MNAPLPESIRKALETVTLDDKYTLGEGRAFMSGVQALVRLPMLQRQRDAAAGLNTAGFISGYRGSPLGTYDQALWAAKKHLAANNIVFQPGVNEELGATAVWGTHVMARAIVVAATHNDTARACDDHGRCRRNHDRSRRCKHDWGRAHHDGAWAAYHNRLCLGTSGKHQSPHKQSQFLHCVSPFIPRSAWSSWAVGWVKEKSINHLSG